MKFLTNAIQDIKSNAAICYIFENENSTTPLFNYLNKLSNNILYNQIFEYETIKGKPQEVFKLSIDKYLTAIVIGLGKKEDFTIKKYSQALAYGARCAKNIPNVNSIAFELMEHNCGCNIESNFTFEDSARMIPVSVRIGLYEFKKYTSNKNTSVETIEILSNEINKKIERNIQIGAYSSYAMKFAKDLVNEQAQIATPQYISQMAQDIAKEYNLDIKVYNKNQIKELNMNAFLAVGQGSVNEPKFIHLCYTPKNTPRKKIALVGKGITFDAGGMNIKPATSMLTMKSDMTGAASVIGIIQAISKLNVDIELHAVCALCENMTSGSAYKQGDVLKASNGKTIEVDNTDAEGRITLADALSYCDNLNVDEVIDIATLTGAAIVALGSNITAVLGNNQKQIDAFQQIAKISGENTWQMPIIDELKENLKSEIADMKNTGGRNAGTSTAGWFLSNFTKSTSWMHLDIAGTAYIDKSNKETLQGPTGVMIRSLINYLLS